MRTRALQSHHLNLKVAFIYTDYSGSEDPESMRIINAQRSRFLRLLPL